MAHGESIEVRPVGRRVSQWGEGPLWWEDALLYVDIEDHKVVRLTPDTGAEEVWDVGERVGTVVPRAAGGLVIAGDNGFAYFDPGTGEKSPIADPEREKKPDNRFNDGKCDPQGRFWAGTISTVKKTGDAALYRLDPDGTVRRMLGDITNSNGICWTSDGRTLYYIDTPTKTVREYGFDPDTGTLSGGRVAVDTAALGLDGSPDGMAIDLDDRIWVAMCHAGCVLCFDPGAGEVLRRVALPCAETTACAFGGPDLGRLYVTTGIKRDLEEADAGRVFVVEGLGVRGAPAVAFAG